jgi:hypothetical protein
MSAGTDWLAVLLATDTPALPAPWVMRLGLSVGWALVLALLGAGLGYRLAPGKRRLLAATLALWALLPGPVTPDYWLGLAFHAPSLTAMLLCGWALQHLLFPSGSSVAAPSLTSRTDLTVSALLTGGLLWSLLALGYLLLLDTFAVLPLQLYAWGFSPALLLGLLALSLLPWLLRGTALAGQGSQRWLLPAALLLFAATRLPTGNLWDALLDPWLWLVFNGLLVRRLYRRWRA